MDNSTKELNNVLRQIKRFVYTNTEEAARLQRILDSQSDNSITWYAQIQGRKQDIETLKFRAEAWGIAEKLFLKWLKDHGLEDECDENSDSGIS